MDDLLANPVSAIHFHRLRSASYRVPESRRLRRGFGRHQQISFLKSIAFLAALSISGCASNELILHEEKHCDGFEHQSPDYSQVAFVYEWVKKREASKKPWVYMYVDDPNHACRLLGMVQTASNVLIRACAIWRPENCLIVLPK